jgi:hypothetical protein
MDVSTLGSAEKTIRGYFHQQRIPKIHHATQYQIFRNIKKHDYKVIAIVRNPLDRITSHAFHQRYKPEGKGLDIIKDAEDDKQAVKVAFNHVNYRIDNEKQFILMTPRCSTFAFRNEYENSFDGKYIWTTYEWLKRDTILEINTILDFLGIERTEVFINSLIKKHSFRNKSGREPGQEKRKDEWKRKGVNDDWVNWFTPEMYENGKLLQETYYMITQGEELLEHS